MGRYYYGDIEGTFWYGCQASDDAEQFGAEQAPTIRYRLPDDVRCKERLIEIFDELGVPHDFKLAEEDVRRLYEADPNPDDERTELYASLEMGLKMYQCFQKTGQCSFEAEI